MQKVEGSSPFSRSSEKPCYLQGFFRSAATSAAELEFVDAAAVGAGVQQAGGPIDGERVEGTWREVREVAPAMSAVGAPVDASVGPGDHGLPVLGVDGERLDPDVVECAFQWSPGGPGVRALEWARCR